MQDPNYLITQDSVFNRIAEAVFPLCVELRLPTTNCDSDSPPIAKRENDNSTKIYSIFGMLKTFRQRNEIQDM